MEDNIFFHEVVFLYVWSLGRYCMFLHVNVSDLISSLVFYCGGMNLSLRRYCPLWVKTLTDLLNPTSGRDTSHLQLISARPKWRCTTHVVHPFLRFDFCIFTLQNDTVWIVLGLLLVFTKMVLFFDDLAKIKYISMHMCHLTAKTNCGK